MARLLTIHIDRLINILLKPINISVSFCSGDLPVFASDHKCTHTESPHLTGGRCNTYLFTKYVNLKTLTEI